jgi:hypothetical protein
VARKMMPRMTPVIGGIRRPPMALSARVCLPKWHIPARWPYKLPILGRR